MMHNTIYSTWAIWLVQQHDTMLVYTRIITPQFYQWMCPDPIFRQGRRVHAENLVSGDEYSFYQTIFQGSGSKTNTRVSKKGLRDNKWTYCTCKLSLLIYHQNTTTVQPFQDRHHRDPCCMFATCTCIWRCPYFGELQYTVEPPLINSGVGSILWLVRRGRGRATTCELYAKIIAESELLQPALNEIHKFCFQHWSRGRRTCGTGSGAPDNVYSC